ncbi:Uncharacterised protein [Streptococcus pneumoniae]|nr:Uncharacterised protein [Streptococcus pneumoniae]
MNRAKALILLPLRKIEFLEIAKAWPFKKRSENRLQTVYTDHLATSYPE